MYVTCRNCGAPLEDNAKFCIHCGTPIAATPPAGASTCPRCGTALDPALKFCTNCGLPQSPPASAAPAVPLTAYVGDRSEPAKEKGGLQGWLIALIVAGVIAVLAVVMIFVWPLLNANGRDDSSENATDKSRRTTTAASAFVRTRPTEEGWTQPTTPPTTRSTTTTRPTQPTGYRFTGVTTDALNVRRDPSTRYDRVGMLRKGTTVTIVGESGDFWEIEYTWKADGASGATAFVHKDYVSLNSNTTVTTQASTIDFEYIQINNYTEIKITKYIGRGGAVTVPTTLSGKPVREIGNSAFAGSSVTSVTIPEGVTTISDWAFWDCTSLSGITLPKSLSHIGDRAFDGCFSLSTVNYKGKSRSDLSIGYGNDALEDATWTS